MADGGKLRKRDTQMAETTEPTVPNAVAAQPPSYAAVVPHTRSLQDLHIQIKANASILWPISDRPRPSDDHIEVVTAVKPIVRASSSSSSNEKASPHVRTGEIGHYAVLVKRTNSKNLVKMIIKSDLKPTMEDALEDLLRRTEEAMHKRVVQCGQQMEDTECCVM